MWNKRKCLQPAGGWGGGDNMARRKEEGEDLEAAPRARTFPRGLGAWLRPRPPVKYVGSFSGEEERANLLFFLFKTSFEGYACSI